jgi:hypothetical protein
MSVSYANLLQRLKRCLTVANSNQQSSTANAVNVFYKAKGVISGAITFSIRRRRNEAPRTGAAGLSASLFSFDWCGSECPEALTFRKRHFFSGSPRSKPIEVGANLYLSNRHHFGKVVKIEVYDRYVHRMGSCFPF